MTRSRLWRLTRAIYQKLKDESASWSTTAGVYDWVPDDASEPYVRIGQSSEVDPPFKGAGYQIFQGLEIVSRAGGRRELGQVIEQATDAVRAFSTPVDIGDGFVLEDVQREEVTADDEEDERGGVVHVAIARFRCVVRDTLGN